MMSKTILYIGFSFSDEYINELRSATMMMLGADNPIAYAIVNDQTKSQLAFFRQHEGVHMLNYETVGGKVWDGFDAYLRKIRDATNPVHTWAAGMGSKRVLWSGSGFATMEIDKFFQAAKRFGIGIQIDIWQQKFGDAVQWTMERLRDQEYHLVVADWDDIGAFELLTTMRAEVDDERRCPVILVFAESGKDFEDRKAKCLRAGARQCVVKVGTLLAEMYAVLASAANTA